MDVSPKTLREVEFREKMRGYHPEDVDQFLERVAAGIEVLQDRLRQALERAQKAEAQASESGADEALKRTLVLAQRTADLAVQEAREQAARILAGAEQQAQAMIAEAEGEVRQAHDRAVAELQAEITSLQADRGQLQLDVDALTLWVGEQREQLTRALQAALASVQAADLRSSPPLGAGPSGAPAGAPDAPGGGAGTTVAAGDTPAGPPGPAASHSDDPDISGGPGGPGDAGAGGGAPGPASAGHGDPAPATPSGGIGAVGAGGEVALDARDGHPGPGPQPVPGGEGPDTMAWQLEPESEVVAVGAQEGDPYFAGLRQAVTAGEPLGPRDLDEPEAGATPLVPARPSGDAIFDQDVAEHRRTGGVFRRRR
jgi:cell division initiation protein